MVSASVPLSPLPLGPCQACGSPQDQMCHFRREGDQWDMKDFLPSVAPGLGRAFGQGWSLASCLVPVLGPLSPELALRFHMLTASELASSRQRLAGKLC